MNILIATGHPAQIHNFRLVKKLLEEHGHQVFWLSTNKDISLYLLNYYHIDYQLLKRPKRSFFSKIKTLYNNCITTRVLIKKRNIDFVISRINPAVVLAAFMSNVKQIGLADTEASGIYDVVFSKLLGAVLTGNSFEKDFSKNKHIRFKGNIELFYLHPNRFVTRQESGHQILGIDAHTPYIILRFVAWEAYHDVGHHGFSEENKLKTAEVFSQYAKVFISSEKPLAPELSKYQIKIPFEKMHTVLKDATMFFGEGASMASESAVLGTPAIYINDLLAGCTNEETKYGILFSFKQDVNSQKLSIEKGIELLQTEGLKDIWNIKLQSFLSDKIDVTAFLVWFVEKYPVSKKIMKQNPDYQNRFK
ncbi:hypothetical protein [uncultured Bacteroides sp.]|uniref:hypothetical protein n=1 Tax=uncultured Bacteroides sp. TaxID=162156 RepID=UPI002AA8A7D1|nr:hypothetical protein [uncultured Bacteroides sp.]